MSKYSALILYSLASFVAFLVSISPFTNFFPQIIALATTIILYFSLRYQKLPLHLIIFIVSLIVFATHGVNSPLYFLIYFLLFIIAFQNPPLITLAYSTVLILLLSQSLNSLASIIPLFSLMLITPLAWLVGQQQLENYFLSDTVARDETDIFLWLSLRLKNTLVQIIDSSSLLLSDPKLTHSQKTELRKVKQLSQDLLTSSQHLTQSVTNNDSSEA